MKYPDLVIWQNVSSHEAYLENSFIGILHEQEIWDNDAYWKVDKALFDIAEKYRDLQMPRELLLAIFDLYEYTFGRLCWHQMPSDGSSIKNLTDEECFLRWERLAPVVRAALGGYSEKNDTFDVINPLLVPQ